MCDRLVLTHPEMGIYLGCFLGLGFWTLLDTAGQPEAVTFLSEQDALDYVKSWDDKHRLGDYRCVAVPTRRDYATVSDLSKAGLTHLLGDMRANVETTA